MRAIFPLLETKAGKPRKKQPPVVLSINGTVMVFRRGVIVEIPKSYLELAVLCNKREYVPMVEVTKVSYIAGMGP